MSELAQALAEVQKALPRIVKGETAKVPTKDGGSYSYTYADLAGISEQLLPLLTKHDLSFIAKPTVTEHGFVLAYSLLHTSGEREDGSYPLPTNGTPQQVGSAITYARRYCLCAVTGVAPEDDDGQAAEQASRAPAGPSHDDLMDQLTDLVADAHGQGVEGDYDTMIDWAGESVANARAAITKLNKAIAAKAAA